jgi:hypothetical protein
MLSYFFRHLSLIVLVGLTLVTAFMVGVEDLYTR